MTIEENVNKYLKISGITKKRTIFSFRNYISKTLEHTNT